MTCVSTYPSAGPGPFQGPVPGSFLPPQPPEAVALRRRGKRLTWVGAVLMVLGLLAIVAAVALSVVENGRTAQGIQQLPESGRVSLQLQAEESRLIWLQGEAYGDGFLVAPDCTAESASGEAARVADFDDARTNVEGWVATARITASEAGVYYVTCTGAEDPLGIGRESEVAGVGELMLTGILLGLAGFVVLIIGLARLNKAGAIRRQHERMLQYQAWTGGSR